MKSTLLEIGPITVHSYGLMIAIGIIAAFWVAEKRASKYGCDSDKLFNLGIFAVTGGIVGAKLLYYIIEIKNIIANPGLLLDISNGFVVYGGIIGGVLAGLLYCKWKKMSFWRYFDLIVPSIALAQGFGRIGCFLAGCCYGRETDAWYGIAFHDSHIAPNGVKMIPTQLISSAADFVNFFVLICFAKRVKNSGEIAGLYLLNYSIGRFLIEFLRNDYRGSIGIFSTSQFISLFIFAVGAMIMALSRKGIFNRKSK